VWELALLRRLQQRQPGTTVRIGVDAAGALGRVGRGRLDAESDRAFVRRRAAGETR